jgi:Sodium/hydrogen exchanger family
VIITAAVVAGSVVKQLNLGSIVALLVVGMILGPHSPKPLFTGHVEELRTLGEIGVILLLFLVGLEIKPEKLSSMRRLFFGLGTAQFLLTAIIITGLLIAVARLRWPSALSSLPRFRAEPRSHCRSEERKSQGLLWRHHQRVHDEGVGGLARPRRDCNNEGLFRSQTIDQYTAALLS